MAPDGGPVHFPFFRESVNGSPQSLSYGLEVDRCEHPPTCCDGRKLRPGCRQEVVGLGKSHTRPAASLSCEPTSCSSRNVKTGAPSKLSLGGDFAFRSGFTNWDAVATAVQLYGLFTVFWGGASLSALRFSTNNNRL